MDAILRRLAPRLRDVPGSSELAIFGSRALGTHDERSDLDLELVVSDLEAAGSACLAAVGELGVEVALTLCPDRAWSVVLCGQSPMHRVDIGICRVPAATPRRILWRQRPPPSRPAAVPAFPVTRPGTCAHAVLDLLIGAVRSVKEYHRGDEARARRRLAAIVGSRQERWDSRVLAAAAAHLLEVGVSRAVELGETFPVAPARRLVAFLQQSASATIDRPA